MKSSCNIMMIENSCILDIESIPLQPWEHEARIICIGCMDVDTEETSVFYNENERKMLVDFLHYFRRKKFYKIIAYNASFDVRYIFARCLKYSLSASDFFRSDIVDLMQIMRTAVKIYGSYNRAGKLEQWLNLLGSSKLALPDSIKNLYRKGDISTIIKYNKVDVEQTYKLWKKVQRVMGVI